MFTKEQIKELQAPLSRQSVKIRSQSGRTLSYIEGWHAIAEANRIFGFENWDRSTDELRLVSERARKIGKDAKDGWSVSYIAKVRITVIAGERVVVRDGTGSGHGIDVDCGLAHESAIKEAETDAMKRALMTFGNPFGLALYDKEQSDVSNESTAQRQEREQAAEAYVKGAASSVAAFRAIPPLKAWWDAQGAERVRLGILKGTPHFAVLWDAFVAKGSALKAAAEAAPAEPDEYAQQAPEETF
jgi:recombination DNA repair RAD52 pathway protein